MVNTWVPLTARMVVMRGLLSPLSILWSRDVDVMVIMCLVPCLILRARRDTMFLRKFVVRLGERVLGMQ